MRPFALSSASPRIQLHPLTPLCPSKPWKAGWPTLAWVLVLVLAFLASGWPTQARAGTFAAFGPQSYPRSTGAPIPFSSSFTVVNPSAQYVLQVQSEGMPTASISINGVTVVFHSDFDTDPAFITKPVVLQASNVLSGVVQGKPDGSITVSIVGIDNDLPVLIITSPSNGATVNSSPITVTGTATDPSSGIASVTCNGAPAMPVGSDFNCVVALAEGYNSIEVRATDIAGNTVTESLSVTLGEMPDPMPNSIEITPGALALVVDEPRQLALVDDCGRTVVGASWVVSDPSVAQITTTGQIILTGKGVGWVTITAMWWNLSAQAEATVYAGPELPQGTVRWSVQPKPGLYYGRNQPSPACGREYARPLRRRGWRVEPVARAGAHQ